MSNFLFNFDQHGHAVHVINYHFPREYRMSELNFYSMFREMERLVSLAEALEPKILETNLYGT